MLSLVVKNGVKHISNYLKTLEQNLNWRKKNSWLKVTHLDKSWPELILVLKVNVDKVTFPDLTSDGVQLWVVGRNDWQETGQLVVNKVVVVL